MQLRDYVSTMIYTASCFILRTSCASPFLGVMIMAGDDEDDEMRVIEITAAPAAARSLLFFLVNCSLQLRGGLLSRVIRYGASCWHHHAYFFLSDVTLNLKKMTSPSWLEAE